MQALPISQRATDIGQLFAGGGEIATSATGRQAGKARSQGEVVAGSFLAALTLGEGDGESDGETAPRDGAGFELNAQQGDKEQRDRQGEGPVVAAVGSADVAEHGEATEVAPANGSFVPGWRWTEVESGSPKLSLVAGEVDGDVPDGNASIVRWMAEESRQGTQLDDRGRVVSLVPAEKAINQPAALPPLAVSPMSTVGGRDFVGTGNDVPGTASGLDVPVVELFARDTLGPRTVQVSVPRTTVARAPESHVRVTHVPPPPTNLEVVAPQILAAERDIQDLLLEPPSTDVRGDQHLPELHTGAGRGEQAEARPAATPLPRESRPEQREPVETTPVEKSPSGREERRTSPREESVRVQVEMRESVERRRAGAVAGRPVSTTETRPTRRVSHTESPLPTKDDAIEKLPHELPVENFTTEGSEPADGLPEGPQDGKAVENVPRTPIAERFDSVKYRAKVGYKGSTEVLARGHERPASVERDAPDWMSDVVVSNAPVEALRGVAEVSIRSSNTQSDDREVRPVESGTKEAGTGLAASRKAEASRRLEAVDIEVYRLTMEASWRDEPTQLEALKPFRNKELMELVAIRTGNPQPVDKESNRQAVAWPTSTSREHDTAERHRDAEQAVRKVFGGRKSSETEVARKSQANQTVPLFGTTDEESTEPDTAREGSADKRPSEPSRQRAERHTAGTIRTVLGPEADVDLAQPRKQVDPALFVETGKAGLKPQAKRVVPEATKPDTQTAGTLGSKAVEGTRTPVAATPSSSTLPDKAPDMPTERPVAATDALRKAVVETALLDRRADQNTLQIQVKDDRLGRVVVRLTERAGLIRAMVRTDGTQARDLLSQQLPALMDSLVRRGFETRQDGLAEQSSHGRENPGSRDERPRQRPPQRQRREGRGAKPEFRIRLN